MKTVADTRVLFITKRRPLAKFESNGALVDVPNQDPYAITVTSGLYNSASFVSQMLTNMGITSKVVQVIDNNDIDREVTQFKPTHVMIEALWVVPEKFDVLTKLHPTVEWVVRLHSEIPFVALDGIAMEWVFKYIKYPNVFVSANSERLNNELSALLGTPTILLPNYYPVDMDEKYQKPVYPGAVHISCFGAIRPLKNHLLQAMAAIRFAKDINCKLYFHVNANRIEDQGQPVERNIRALFAALAPEEAELVCHPWTRTHDDFIEIIKGIDIGMQVSFTETYNIVAADMVNMNVPVVGSDEILWLANFYKAKTTDVDDVVAKLHFAWKYRSIKMHHRNKINLAKDAKKAANTWFDYLLSM